MDQPEDHAGFDQRLRAAEARQESGPGAAASGPPPSGHWGLGLRVGMELVCALAVGVGMGVGLDYWLKTRPLFIVLFLFAGGAAGVLNVWRLMGTRSGA